MVSQPPSNPYQFESQTPYVAPTQVQQLVKPKAIKVFGILNVCLGGLESILAMTTFDLISIPKGESNPAFVTQNANAFLYFYNITTAACGLIFAIVLLASGIGLLTNKKWGRTAGLVWTGYCVLSTIVVSVVTWAHIYPYQLAATAATPNMEAILMGDMIFANVLSVGLLIYPGLFALLSSRQPFRDALN